MHINFEIDNELTKEDTILVDIVCVEQLHYPIEVISCSIVVLTSDKWKIKIRFDWKENNNQITPEDFLYIPETNILFFKSWNQWGAIDISSKTIKRHENSTAMPWIERKGNYILIIDDLKAESTRLNADTIHSVPIDPPTTSKELEDAIEYNSPIFGLQILQTK